MSIEGIGSSNNLNTYLDNLGFNPDQIQEISAQIQADPSKAMQIIENYSANIGVSNTSSQVPELDIPETLDFISENLEKILGLLQIECDEEQLEVAKKRIESLKGQIESSHEEQLNKIMEQIEEASKADKNSKISQAFAWIGAIVAVIAAVALTLCTGGAMAGAAIGGAIMAVTSLICNETGATEMLQDALLDSIKENFPDMSSKDQQIFAAVSQMLISLAATVLACATGGGVAHLTQMAAQAPKLAAALAKIGPHIGQMALELAGSMTSQTAQTGVQGMSLGVSILMGLATTSAGAASTAVSYDASMLQKEVKELEAFLTMLQKTMEDEQKILEELMQNLQNSIGAVIQLVETDKENQDALLSNLGSNAAMV